MPAEMFRATTFLPGEWHLQDPLIERPRILEILSRNLQSGSVNWMVGPVGAGKSTIGLQWAQSLGSAVHYVSASPLRILTPDSEQHEPDEFGIALKDLLNVSSRQNPDATREEIAGYLDRVIALSKEEPRSFILDDLHQIRRQSMNILLELFGAALPNLHVDRALFISRTMDSGVLGGLQALKTLRMILPEMLPFDSEEAVTAQEQGVFGTATAAQVESAREKSHGWISGMLVDLHGHGGRTQSPLAFRNLLLNELLMDQPPPILQAMVASANLPFNHREIWERWFEHLGLPHYIVPSMAAQLPLSEATNPPGRVNMSPVMSDALRNIQNITLSDEVLHELLSIALAWYIHHQELAAAVEMAIAHGLQSQLLQGLKHHYDPLAEIENWSKIREGLRQIPEDILLQDSDLTFWYFHGLVEDDGWPAMKRLHDRTVKLWRDSDDPVNRGRADLVDAWNAHMLNEADSSVELSSSAYHTLPENLHRDRMWAAGTASIANSLRGNWEEARRWSSLVNLEVTYMPHPSRWWHNNTGPMRYSWSCISGYVNEAYEAAGRQINALGNVYPQQATRYYLLQAQIDLERWNLESAESLLGQAESVAEEFYSQHHHLRMAGANIARAKGDYAAASAILSEGKTPTVQRYDQFAREVVLRSSITFESGAIDSAEALLNSVAPGDRAWPKYFGDVHPELIRALLLHARGNAGDAISIAVETLGEAKRRGHQYYVVRALATLAYIYHHTRQPGLWSESAQQAIEAAGNSGYHLVFTIGSHDIRELDQLPDEEAQAGISRESAADRLTTREIEVLGLVADALSNKQIAEKMFISVSTVKNHLASVYDKLGTNNRRAAVRIAKQFDLIDQ